jgi:hypothetical protein
MDAGVEFIAVDNPHANKTLHILAAVAEHEPRQILKDFHGRRTRPAGTIEKKFN